MLEMGYETGYFNFLGAFTVKYQLESDKYARIRITHLLHCD